jgi:hypothetical protein
MGLDVHGINFLRFASKLQPFGRVATIGRQGLHVPKGALKAIMALDYEVDYGEYCENFLRVHFGARDVVSFDYSGFEGATHIFDLNKPIEIEDRYDTIIDGGTTEHVYNAPQALKTYSQMCVEGGQILHIVPANNFCGHGFWQFSPELFFSLYSTINGYTETQVFLANVTEPRYWYEAVSERNGARIDVISSQPLYALVRTKKSTKFSHENIQQSDYLYDWEEKQNERSRNAAEHATEEVKKSTSRFAASHLLKRFAERTPLFQMARVLKRFAEGPAVLDELSINRYLKKRDVGSIINPGADSDRPPSFRHTDLLGA